jgi:P-type Cu+ transporter
MDNIQWKIEGMSCSNCVLTVSKYLERQGLQNIKLSLVTGDLSFDSPETLDREQLQKGIKGLGYGVSDEAAQQENGTTGKAIKPMERYLRYLLICLPFTILLLLPMLAGHRTNGGMRTDEQAMGRGGNDFMLIAGWLMAPWVQLLICLPVYIAGMDFFGRSAVNSIRNGLPNMNVLIAVGSTAAFLYSVAGTIFGLGADYSFYETAALIITLVFFGYYLEDVSIRATQKALNNLARSQKVMANMIAFDESHQEIVFPVENKVLKSGDLILIKNGEQVPADCKILWGEAGVDEAIVTGESLPVERYPKDRLIGGSLLLSGMVKAQVTAATKDSVLAGIIGLVKQAQGEKPPVQQLADRISAIFVPVVLGIAALCFLGNYLFLHQFTPSLIRSIAVLVIACPCAMGLATPAAIAVGLGRAAREGILFRNARSLESFAKIRQVVFDKTGTLTTGEFVIGNWQISETAGVNEADFKNIAFSLEKYSSHPIARCITKEWRQKDAQRWINIKEQKGLGMRGETKEGNVYQAGSHKIAASLTPDDTHNIYIVANDRLLGWIDVKDETRPEAAGVIGWLRAKKIRTVLLSGDREAACRQLADRLGIDEVFAEQSPEQKLEKIAVLNAKMPVAMVGDGINDAPALAKATIGISMSDASQIALFTSDLVLMNHGLKHLPEALELGRHTFLTIKQNLFWAFFYNVIAIPVAAFGLLTPALAALAMGFSDVVLAFNSVRLFVKKVVR